jgi:hypothetical protein
MIGFTQFASRAEHSSVAERVSLLELRRPWESAMMPYALGRTISNAPVGGAPKTGTFVQSVIDEIVNPESLPSHIAGSESQRARRRIESTWRSNCARVTEVGLK